MMDILYFLFIGVIAGWAAGTLFRGGGFGLTGNLVIGVIGAILGGFIFRLVGLSATSTLGSIVMSIVGALVLLFSLRLAKRNP